MKKVAIITGYSCNNNCVFCYDGNKRNIKDFSFEEIKERLIEARNRGCDYVDFLGGEFTIRKDCLEIIKFAKRLGFETIALTTNGRMLSYKRFAEEIVDAGVNSIIYSIHGDTSELHDSLTRVKGSFNQITEALDNTRQLGIPFFANVTIVKQNYKQLKKIADFLLNNGCINCEFIYVDPTGLAYNDFEEVVPLIKDSSPYIKEALDLGISKGIKHWHVRYFPLCYLEGYEDYVSEISNPFKKVEHVGPEFNNFDVESSRKRYSRVKSLSCVNCKYVDRCEGVWKVYAEKIGIGELNPVKDLPEEVKIELTYNCNKDCLFCFNKSVNDRKKSLTKIELLKVIDEIAEEGIKAIRFTGGEPLLRRDLAEILEYAKKKKIYVILNTNGELFDEKNISLLKSIDDLLISVHNLEKTDSLYRIINQARKFNVFLRCCTICTRQNISNLEEFYKFFSKNKVDDWFLLRPVPSKTNPNPLNFRDVKILADKIILFNKKYNIKSRIANALPFCAYEKRKIDSVCTGGKFDSGYSRIVIAANGDIKEDYYSEGILGNIKKDNLVRIWNSEHMLNRRRLKLLPSLCTQCEYSTNCLGGMSSNGSECDSLIKRNFRVLLINPKFEDFNLVIEPLALEYIASFLESKGYECRIIDLNIDSIEELFKEISRFNPRLIGVSTFSMQIKDALKIGKIVKESNPNIYLAYGGVYSTFVYGSVDSAINPLDIFVKGNADFVIIGEGEKTFFELADALEKKDFVRLKRIDGICYGENGKVFMNEQRNWVEEIDKIPFPARDLVDIKAYRNDIHIMPYAEDLAVDVITSRGCAFNCSYCTSPRLYGRKLRYRSPENVVAEIEEIVNYHNIKNVHFHDDCFLLDVERVKQICSLILKYNLKFNWLCLASIPSLKKSIHILPMMRKAGCIGIEIGLESCDPHVLKRMNKNQTCSDALIIDKTLKRNGIIPLYLMISFFPGETLNTSFLNASFLNKVHDKNTRIVDYLKAVHLPYSFGQFATPYKGTSFENIAEKEGIIFDTGYNRQKVSFIPNSLLDDIPIKTREIDKNDFCSIIDKFKGEILYYLGDSSILGFREYNKYKEFIYSLYSKVDGSHPVKDIVKEQDVRHGCLALKFLAMFGMINSKNR